MISKAQTSKNYTNPAEPVPDHSKIKEKIAKLVKRKLYKIGSNSDQLHYKTDFKIGDLSDILYNIASIMKVCIIAIDNADTGYNTQLLQFHINIQNALQHVLQLLPFEEVECLEGIIEAYDLPYDTAEKEDANNIGVL